MKVVKLNGVIVYKQIPDFEDGMGIKNATILFGEDEYIEENISLEDIPLPKEKPKMDTANFDKANSIATLKEALKPLLGLGG